MRAVSEALHNDWRPAGTGRRDERKYRINTSTIPGPLDGAGFRGRTAAVPWQRPYDPLACKCCGSSLYGRRVSEQHRQTSRGIAVVVETFRCRCGRGRHIKREAVA
jgi:hypothetical protein